MTKAEKTHLTHAHVTDLLKGMIRIRHFEDKCAELYTQQKIRGFLHLYDGEEAIAIGVISVLGKNDRIVATYREHGHALARGVPMPEVMAEMYGKAEGCSGGRGGSMHLFHAPSNFFGGNAIVGGGLPLAGGLALGDKLSGADGVTVCFFGEGAVAEGEFHETMNLAELWDVPALFVCENNGYAMGSALAARNPRPTSTPRRPPTASRRKLSTARTWSPSRRPPAVPSPAFARPADPISSNAAPIASAPIRCSTRSSTATRRRSRSSAPRGRSSASRDGCSRTICCRTATSPASRPKSMPRSLKPWPLPRPEPGSRWRR
jgi:hypothetical protein